MILLLIIYNTVGRNGSTCLQGKPELELHAFIRLQRGQNFDLDLGETARSMDYFVEGSTAAQADVSEPCFTPWRNTLLPSQLLHRYLPT